MQCFCLINPSTTGQMAGFGSGFCYTLRDTCKFFEVRVHSCKLPFFLILLRERRGRKQVKKPLQSSRENNLGL